MLVNVNVGIMGHVDSGKTSIAKLLSTMASTAAFDKNPQSKERGITLDLGFSVLKLSTDFGELQVTFVDCPGHSSLIRTVIGGSQIMDLVLLVIDGTKGFQTQTSECLIISEIAVDKLIVILNKVDLFEEQERMQKIEKVSLNVRKVLARTKFADAPIIPFSTKMNAGDAFGINNFLSILSKNLSVPKRICSTEKSFLYYIDHCFVIKGKGSVVTGTIIKGKICINEVLCVVISKEIQFPMQKRTFKVKSIQVFKNPVNEAHEGDRCAILLGQTESLDIERTLACTPNTVKCQDEALFSIQKVKYFKHEIKSKTKYHLSIGHETVMGLIFLLKASANGFELIDCYEEGCLCWIQFESLIPLPAKAMLIASRLDFPQDTKECRIAFHGILNDIHFDKSKVFVWKKKIGQVDRIMDDFCVLIRGLAGKESKLDLYMNKKISLGNDIQGVIESSFGQSGKLKARFNAKHEASKDATVTLTYKKFIFTPKGSNKLFQ